MKITIKLILLILSLYILSGFIFAIYEIYTYEPRPWDCLIQGPATNFEELAELIEEQCYKEEPTTFSERLTEAIRNRYFYTGVLSWPRHLLYALHTKGYVPFAF